MPPLSASAEPFVPSEPSLSVKYLFDQYLFLKGIEAKAMTNPALLSSIKSAIYRLMGQLDLFLCDGSISSPFSDSKIHSPSQPFSNVSTGSPNSPAKLSTNSFSVLTPRQIKRKQRAANNPRHRIMSSRPNFSQYLLDVESKQISIDNPLPSVTKLPRTLFASSPITCFSPRNPIISKKSSTFTLVEHLLSIEQISELAKISAMIRETVERFHMTDEDVVLPSRTIESKMTFESLSFCNCKGWCLSCGVSGHQSTICNTFCSSCDDSHPTYKCPKFLQWLYGPDNPELQRWLQETSELIRNSFDGNPKCH